MMRDEKPGLLARPVPAAFFMLAFVIVASASLLAGTRAMRDRSRLVTGGARWIWFSLEIDEPKPVRFYARRDFTIARAPASAKALLHVDRRGVLSINGSRFPATEQRPGSPLAVIQIAPALVAGNNSLVIEAESPTGAGGILFHLDLSEGTSIDSDASWRVALSESELARGGGVRAAVWGRPPMYPWLYPRIDD